MKLLFGALSTTSTTVSLAARVCETWCQEPSTDTDCCSPQVSSTPVQPSRR
ncbi:MAG: hypothetical protein KTR31_32610 [Myxococcales bacterium]|nr:hypothetical protein [Myxococcales bacterium]